MGRRRAGRTCWPPLDVPPALLEALAVFCPALAAPKEWCHDSWTFERPAFMGAVDALVGTRRETLKAT